MYRPGEGVFGKSKEGNLRKRKEQKEQLSDLVPDFAHTRSDISSRKRKLDDIRNSRNNKRPGADLSNKTLFPSKPRTAFTALTGSVLTKSPAMATRRDLKMQVTPFGFLLNTGNDSKVKLIQQCPQIPAGGRLRFFSG